MQNRRRLLAAGIGALGVPAGVGRAASAMDEHYAESVAMDALSGDLATSLGVRLARFPPQGTGSAWISVHIAGTDYSVVDPGLSLTEPGPTPVHAAMADFQVTGTSEARFESFERGSSAMHGRVRARSLLKATGHPEPGPGDIPASIDARFRVVHAPVQVRPGRTEVMGYVSALVVVDGVRHEVEAPGKWHEQIGPRPRFAPAFTYFFVQGDGIGLMVSRHARGAWGYVFAEGRTARLVAFEIDPYGTPTRRFTATLADGREISGTATVLRETSVPIEGKRRPGATVTVKSDLGSMAGALNDWNPKA